jgi:hypothetical protein
MGVGDRATQEPADHQRHQREDRQQANVEAVQGQSVDLKAYCHQGQLASDGGYGRAQPEPPEGLAFLERRDVSKQFPHPATLVLARVVYRRPEVSHTLL